MGKLKTWLQQANGWKRMWFALSAIFLFWAAVWYPLMQVNSSYESRHAYLVERDYENPECAPYFTKPVRELHVPQFQSEGGSCWHLYQHRDLYKPTKLPYTLGDFRSDIFWGEWGTRLGVAGMMSAVAAVLSALVYFAGVLVAWVIAGFKK